MSLIVKGFVTDTAFISNTKDEVSSVFELSSKGQTYAKDKTLYSLASYPANDLVVFKAIDQQTGVEFTLSNASLPFSE